MTDRRLRVLSGTGADVTADMASLIAVLDSARVTVRFGSKSTWQQQAMVIMLVDLLGRLLPCIDVIVDGGLAAAPELPPGADLLRDRIDQARRNGGLPRLDGSSTGAVVVLDVGCCDADQSADLHVDGHGWQSYLGTAPSRLADRPDSPTVVGPLAAACRAAVAVMARVLAPHSVAAARALEVTPEGCYSSALTYEYSTDPLDEPVVSSTNVDGWLVGAGSVGGAVAYTIAYTPGAHGELAIIDPQALEDHNPDRALLATASAAEAGEVKVAVAEAALAHHGGLTVHSFQGTVTAFHAQQERETAPPVVVAAVDSARSRRAVQDCLPLEVINAACHPNEIMVSGHRTDDGPCVCCLHMDDVLDAKHITWRLIADKTGLPREMVIGLVTNSVPLQETHIAGIERNMGLNAGSLRSYLGRTLLELWRGGLLYGVTPVTSATGAVVAVAAPYITALAGVLAAGELLKAGAGASASEYRLGPAGPASVYREDPAAGAALSMTSNPPRFRTSECLCRSPRRLRIMRQRYGLDVPAVATE